MRRSKKREKSRSPADLTLKLQSGFGRVDREGGGLRDARGHAAVHKGHLGSILRNRFGRNLRIKPNLVKNKYVNIILNGFKMP
jgi:hypothetical protein